MDYKYIENQGFCITRYNINKKATTCGIIVNVQEPN